MSRCRAGVAGGRSKGSRVSQGGHLCGRIIQGASYKMNRVPCCAGRRRRERGINPARSARATRLLPPFQHISVLTPGLLLYHDASGHRFTRTMKNNQPQKLTPAVVNRRLGLCAAAFAGTAAAVPSVQATVVTNNINASVPATFAGIYINFQTGQVGASGAATPGFDFNPYLSGAIWPSIGERPRTEWRRRQRGRLQQPHTWFRRVGSFNFSEYTWGWREFPERRDPYPRISFPQRSHQRHQLRLPDHF